MAMYIYINEGCNWFFISRSTQVWKTGEDKKDRCPLHIALQNRDIQPYLRTRSSPVVIEQNLMEALIFILVVSCCIPPNNFWLRLGKMWYKWKHFAFSPCTFFSLKLWKYPALCFFFSFCLVFFKDWRKTLYWHELCAELPCK